MPKRYTPNDKWSKKATAEGYRARSVYKLIELDEKFALLTAGITVLDAGASPGSWLQYTAQQIGPTGIALGFDLKPIEPIAENVTTYEQDITDIEAMREILNKKSIHKCDLILSDLAPNTSGIWDIDQWRSIELSQAVLQLAKAFLKPSGRCVLKVFRGADFDEFIQQLKEDWNMVKTAQVQATRDRSKEIYVIIQS